MAERRDPGCRSALAEITTRRMVLGASMLGAAGLLTLAQEADAKKKNKRKKRCRNGAKRCGKGCCKAPSVCSASSCFCTGGERNCTSIPEELIKLIAEALGISPDQVGQDPDQPLAQCPTISQEVKQEINFEIRGC